MKTRTGSMRKRVIAAKVAMKGDNSGSVTFKLPSAKVAATELLLHNIRDMLREGRASFRGTLLAELLGPYIGNVKELFMIGNEVRAETTKGYAISVVVVIDRVTK